MAELGAAVVASVLAVLDNPAAAKTVVVQHAEARRLTDEQQAEYEKALQCIKDAAQVDARQKQLDAELKRWQEELEEKNNAHRQAVQQHSTNVDNFNRAQKAHDTKIALLERREKACDDMEDGHTYWQTQLQKRQDDVKLREEAVKKREDALRDFQKKLGG
jgi:hypothetical protein